MPNFVKVFCYNRYDSSTVVPIYLNINFIESLEMMVDKEENVFIVHLSENSYRLTHDSYIHLVGLLYGKEYMDGDKR